MDHLHVASQRSRPAIAVSTVVALIAALILVISPSRSLAAGTGDQIYWGNEGRSAVRSGNLDGRRRRGRAPRRDAVRSGARPRGRARSTGPTGSAAGSGSGTSTAPAPHRPCSPRAGKPLRGGGRSCGEQDLLGQLHHEHDPGREPRRHSSPPSTLFTEPGGSGPSGVAIDPAAGKIYWTNQYHRPGPGREPDGSGTAATLFGNDAPLPTVEDNPIGVAIDPAAGKIYWTNLGLLQRSGQVRVGNLDGTGTPSTLFDSESGPGGPSHRPRGEQDLLGHLRPRRYPFGEPGRQRASPRPCSAARAHRSSPRF